MGRLQPLRDRCEGEARRVRSRAAHHAGVARRAVRARLVNRMSKGAGSHILSRGKESGLYGIRFGFGAVRVPAGVPDCLRDLVKPGGTRTPIWTLFAGTASTTPGQPLPIANPDQARWNVGYRSSGIEDGAGDREHVDVSSNELIFDAINKMGLKLDHGDVPQPVLSIVKATEQPTLNAANIAALHS